MGLLAKLAKKAKRVLVHPMALRALSWPYKAVVKAASSFSIASFDKVDPA